MTETMQFAIVLAILLPLSFYIREGWRDRRMSASTTPPTRSDELVEFFAADRSLSVRQYATTTVAYGLQMAAVVLFAQWGYYYGLASLLVPLAWCCGFLLLALAAGRLDVFLQKPQTLHSYLGEIHGGSNLLVKVAAGATMLGLGGALFAELGYTADLLQHLLGRSVSFKYVIMSFFLIAALSYVLPGGFWAVVATDRRQLPLGYLGLAVLLGSIIFAGSSIGASTAAAATTGVLAFAAIAVVGFIGVASAQERTDRAPLVVVLIPLASLAVVIIAYIAGVQQSLDGSTLVIQRDEWMPTRMTAVTALSLVLANGFWQFVDLSAFQRLTALRLPDEPEARIHLLRKGILLTAFESPISWCIGIAIGVGLGSLGTFGGIEGAWTAYELFLVDVSNGGGIGAVIPHPLRWVVVAMSLAALVSIMLSSVDSFGAAVAYTASADIARFHATPASTKSTRRRAQVLTVLLLVGMFLLFAGWQAYLSEEHNISAWLYTGYAMQLSLFGACISALLGVALHRHVAAASVLFAALASGATGAFFVMQGDPSVFVLPPIIALSVSLVIVIYPLGRTLIRRKPVNKNR